MKHMLVKKLIVNSVIFKLIPLIKLRCKETVKKLPKVIPPKKGKQKPFQRRKRVDLDENQQ